MMTNRGSSIARSSASVPSVQRSSTKMTSIDGQSPARMLRAQCAALPCSLWAGTITETMGSGPGSGSARPSATGRVYGRSFQIRNATIAQNAPPASARADSTMPTASCQTMHRV
ncbi:MAG: hypothetical protein RLZZ217_2076 [Planctomycetota bacterium]